MSSQNHINNRRHMLKHPSQGNSKKVLCVCSGGLLRSPTVAWVLSNPPFNFNTRSCGITDKYALIQIDDYLLEWADEIVCVEEDHAEWVKSKLVMMKLSNAIEKEPPVRCLNLSDDYLYRDPQLIEAATKQLKEIFHEG